MSTKKEGFVLYNSLTKRKEPFKPLVPNKVGMYVCGITSYALSHIGHARAAVSFDILYRYLKHLGYDVTYVRNFTDIDDKIIRQANENKRKQVEEQGNADEYESDPLKLSKKFCDEYLVDMGNLQCLLPTKQPYVTEHIEQIKDMITQIINNGYAYVVDGDVFYEVEKFPNYGMLSGQKLEHIRAGERVDVDSRKRNPADFALWKAAKPEEPSWDSPWGPGRPGWHIECSAMSAHYLSYKFDIHGGGIDLIFPHHENEIAQSCAACKESTVTYWLHNGHVTNKDVKMSKSLGNYSTIRQITKDFHGLALRHFLISAHYSSPLNYSVSQLDSSSEAIFYIYQTLQDCEDALLPFEVDGLNVSTENKGKVVGVTADAKKCIAKLKDEFDAKMADDLSTSHILTGAFQDALKFVNSSVSAFKKKMQKQRQLSLVQSLRNIQKEIKVVLDVLGLLSPLSCAEVLQELKEKALIRAGLVEEDILQLIDDRKTARNNKDFAKSDQIRAELSAKGIALMDVGAETIWRPCVAVRQEEQPIVLKQAVPSTVVQRDEKAVSEAVTASSASG